MVWWDKAGLGIRLARPAQVYLGATTPMFTAMGDIFLTSINGVVVAQINAGLNNCSIDTTGGTFIATAVDIDGDLVGQEYSVATAGGALHVAGAPVPGLTQPILIPDTETIDLTCGATTATGTILWVIHYQPAEDGAYVALA